MRSRVSRYEIAAERTVARTVELAAVPAPTFHEGQRADVVRRWWQEEGLAPIIDEVGNVWAEVRSGVGPALVVCAHMDTVFASTVVHGARIEEGRLMGPSVGDNTISLAAISELPDLLPENCGPIWLLATVGEEGLGNLSGIRHALASPQRKIGAMIALEGNYLERVITRGVGSVRWRVTLEGPGGHAWEAASQPSAIVEFARIVLALDEMTDLSEPDGRRVLNVGTMSGGEAINARARYSEFQVDMRSSDPESLAAMEEWSRALIDKMSRVEASIEEIGRRPAGSIEPDHSLVTAAMRALVDVGLSPRLDSASTDANAAYERGIPAVTIGVTKGRMEHTEQEWVSVGPIAQGLEAMVRTIVNTWEEGS